MNTRLTDDQFEFLQRASMGATVVAETASEASAARSLVDLRCLLGVVEGRRYAITRLGGAVAYWTGIYARLDAKRRVTPPQETDARPRGRG